MKFVSSRQRTVNVVARAKEDKPVRPSNKSGLGKPKYKVVRIDDGEDDDDTVAPPKSPIPGIVQGVGVALAVVSSPKLHIF